MRKIMKKSRLSSSYSRQGNGKIILYAVGLAVILGIGAVLLQDIQLPQEHVSQEIKVNID